MDTIKFNLATCNFILHFPTFKLDSLLILSSLMLYSFPMYFLLFFICFLALLRNSEEEQVGSALIFLQPSLGVSNLQQRRNCLRSNPSSPMRASVPVEQ